MMSGIVKYVVVGSVSVLVAANAAFGAIGVVGLLDTALIFLGGAGAGAAIAGLLYRLSRIRRRGQDRGTRSDDRDSYRPAAGSAA